MSKSGSSKTRSRPQQIPGKTLHRVSPLPASAFAFAFFRNPKSSLGIINTSLSQLLRSGTVICFIITISNNNPCLPKAPAQTF